MIKLTDLLPEIKIVKTFNLDETSADIDEMAVGDFLIFSLYNKYGQPIEKCKQQITSVMTNQIRTKDVPGGGVDWWNRENLRTYYEKHELDIRY